MNSLFVYCNLVIDYSWNIAKYCLFIVIWLLIIIPAPTARANTDPKSATSSATATVPTTPATTGDDLPPTAPILIRPVDGTITSDNRPEFVWRRSTDPNGNTVSYILYLNGAATYLGISDLGNSSGGNYTARVDGNEVKLLPTISLLDGTYQWYITASDPSGNTAQSTIWDFTIDTSAPPLTLVDLDTYHNPVIFEGANFDIAGPKDIYFTVLSDPFIDIQITITSPESDIYVLKTNTNSQGLAYLYQHLIPGRYTVAIVAIDRGNNTTALPNFTVTIAQAQITVPLPPFTGVPDIIIPYTPIAIPSLPATIAKLETRLPLAYLAVGLLALALSILLFLLWRRKYNIILLNGRGEPLSSTIVYHSIPDTRRRLTQVLASRREPISYDLVTSDHGRLHIRHLGRYSTLTVKTETRLYIFSLSAKRKIYTIVLG